MSCEGILVHTQFGDICIPVVEPAIDWHPHPDPEKRIFEDLGILVGINQKIRQIGDHGLREHLSQAVLSAAKSVRLPKGVELGDRLFGAGPVVGTTQKVEMKV